MSELIAEISKLSIGHRIELIQAILYTIVSDTAEDTSLTTAQIAIIEKRTAEIAAGVVQPVPWEQVQAKLAERYGLHN